jgi:cytoskeletal protein RodZ
MRTVLGAICIAAACASATWARDPSTPPALGDSPDGSEHSPAASPNRAHERYESETRPKSDELLATAVHDSLSHDKRVNAMQLQVSAQQGVVQLTGTVPREADRHAAETIARRVAGVRDVRNQIQVEASPATPGTSAIPERLHP